MPCAFTSYRTHQPWQMPVDLTVHAGALQTGAGGGGGAGGDGDGGWGGVGGVGVPPQKVLSCDAVQLKVAGTFAVQLAHAAGLALDAAHSFASSSVHALRAAGACGLTSVGLCWDRGGIAAHWGRHSFQLWRRSVCPCGVIGDTHSRGASSEEEGSVSASTSSNIAPSERERSIGAAGQGTGEGEGGRGDG